LIALLALALPVFGLCADEPETEIMARSPSSFSRSKCSTAWQGGRLQGYDSHRVGERPGDPRAIARSEERPQISTPKDFASRQGI
jgi:hypothetical protein